MQTEKVNPTNTCPTRNEIRSMTNTEFIEDHASGTLRKNSLIGFRYDDQLTHERIAFEFGYGFESMPSSRITFNDAMTIGDCKPITEAGWFISRWIKIQSSIFPEDKFETKYIIVEDENGTRREGVGLICRQTSYPYVKNGHIIFAIISEWDNSKKEYKSAINPF